MQGMQKKLEGKSERGRGSERGEGGGVRSTYASIVETSDNILFSVRNT